MIGELERLLLLVYEGAVYVPSGLMMNIPSFHCGRGHGQQVSKEDVPHRAHPLRPQNRQRTECASQGNAWGETFISRVQLLRC